LNLTLQDSVDSKNRVCPNGKDFFVDHRNLKGWIYFSFSRADYRQHGKNRINTFLAELCKIVPKKDRHFYGERKEMQIKEVYKTEFTRLYQKHFMPKFQRNLDF
jgi:hypothetical protein